MTTGPPATPLVRKIGVQEGHRVALVHAPAGWSLGVVPAGATVRRAAGHQSDITDNAVRSMILPLGLVDVKVAALGEDWSGLKTVWRTSLRPRPG